MHIVKIGGLLGSFVSKVAGVPFSEQLSMIAEELSKSSAEIKEGLRHIEEISKGQILGWAESAQIALDNAQSRHLNVEQKLAEITRAKELFERCYGDLTRVSMVSKHRGEIAFAIAACNAMLGIDDRRDDWLKRSVNDFLSFSTIDIKVVSPIAENLRSLLQPPIVLNKEVRIFMDLASRGYITVQSKNELQQIKVQQTEAKQNAKAISLLISQFSQTN